jgi:hypothetical protein
MGNAIPAVRGAERDQAANNRVTFERALAARGAVVTNIFPLPLDGSGYQGRWEWVFGSQVSRSHIQVCIPGIPLEQMREQGVVLLVDGQPCTWNDAIEAAVRNLAPQK